MTLTPCQINAISDIKQDLEDKSKIMKRYIEGDVNSGKTLVAILSIFYMLNLTGKVNNDSVSDTYDPYTLNGIEINREEDNIDDTKYIPYISNNKEDYIGVQPMYL